MPPNRSLLHLPQLATTAIITAIITAALLLLALLAVPLRLVSRLPLHWYNNNYYY